MDNKLQTTLISESSISDLVALLESKGLGRNEVEDTLLHIITEVELEVVEELMSRLPEDKKELLDALVSQEASGEEITKQLELDDDELAEIEADKFANFVDEITKKLA